MDSRHHAKPRIELAIVQITSFCNIDCSYCYLAGRDQKNHLEPNTVAKIVERLFEYGNIVSPFEWQWHAGEPLAIGLDRFIRCQNVLEKSFAYHNVVVNTSLQTNGILINKAWATFFASNNIKVGVSIDGPQDLHDDKRRDRAGRGTHYAAVRGLSHLLSANVFTSALCVIGSQSLNRGADIVRFFGEAGIKQLAFNFEEWEGENNSDTFANYSSYELRTAVSQFVREVVAARNEHYPSMRIREFDNFQVYLQCKPIVHRQLSDPFYCLTIGHQGDVMTFSPELAGAKRADGSTWSFGNIFDDTLIKILDRVLQSEDYDSIKIGVEKCRKDCGYFSFCGGGSPGNKYFENGSFASTETKYCKIRYKYLVDGMLDFILTDDHALS